MQNANGGEPNLYARVDDKHEQSLVTKEASTRQLQTQGRPNHTHNPPSNFPQHQTHQKGGCTRLYKEQLRMYATVVHKPAYTEKAVVKSRTRVNQ